MVRIISSGLGKFVRPCMDDWVFVDVVDAGHDAFFELLFRAHADMPQDGASEFGEEAFDQVEPGAMDRREGELETTSRLGCKPGPLPQRRGRQAADLAVERASSNSADG